MDQHTFDGSGIADFQTNNRALDFLSARHACPKGIYLSPSPEDPSSWEGVLFARTGPYSPGVFRFQIVFSPYYPKRPPQIYFITDVFHPLITPLTTYTHSNQDTGADTVSASDNDRLPPGSFSLRHGYPDWFARRSRLQSQDTDRAQLGQIGSDTGMSPMHDDAGSYVKREVAEDSRQEYPLVAEILFYLRAALTFQDFLDSITLDDAANPSAWHAWRSFSSKVTARSSSIRSKSDAGLSAVSALKQQPGGARSPGEWNWDGVWEDRVRKCIQSSLSEASMFKRSAGFEELIQFQDLDPETVDKITAWT